MESMNVDGMVAQAFRAIGTAVVGSEIAKDMAGMG